MTERKKLNEIAVRRSIQVMSIMNSMIIEIEQFDDPDIAVFKTAAGAVMSIVSTELLDVAIKNEPSLDPVNGDEWYRIGQLDAITVITKT